MTNRYSHKNSNTQNKDSQPNKSEGDKMNNKVKEKAEQEEHLNDNSLLLAVENYDLGENPILTLLEKAVALPGVKVNRTTFLMETYNLSGTMIENENIFLQISLEQMDKAGSSIIAKNVTASSFTAFALGLPGGFAMAASIPADIMQNFAFSLRLAQQLAYIYGFNDLFENNEMSEKTRNTLITFLGIMFGAAGSGTVLRAMAPNIGKYAARQVLKKPLTKTVWYPMLKKITSIVASKTITKKGMSSFVSKAVPVVGGVASAGICVATMIPMANRLKNELRKYYLTEEEIREIEEKDQITFGEKASDMISDVASGSVKAVESAKGLGKNFGNFAKQISEKTKEKIDKSKK